MARKKKGDIVDGWVCLDKPFEMGSTEAVSRIRRLFNAQKAGHAGTLDPLASGILPIALGEATKTVPMMMEAQKVYRFTINWGVSTDSVDREGEIIRMTLIPMFYYIVQGGFIGLAILAGGLNLWWLAALVWPVIVLFLMSRNRGTVPVPQST